MSGRAWRRPAVRYAIAGYAAGLATAGVIALVTAPTAPHGGGEATMAASPAAPRQAALSAAPASSTPAASVSTAAPAAIPQHAAAPLSPEARATVAPLEARLADDPGDVTARKQLAVVLVDNQQLMLAYEHASQLLATDPADPDGLYVHGVVRLAMGHAPRAIELLDRVLERYPDHARALRARADAQRKIGDEGGAALTDARARQAARAEGGEVDRLIAAAEGGTLLEMMRSTPSASTPAAAAGDG